MIRWYVTYWAKTADGLNKFGYVIASTMSEYFPVRQMVENIEEENGYSDCVIINWKAISEIEYLHHEGMVGANVKDAKNQFTE